MEAFKTASLTPISVLCERRTEASKFLSLSVTSPLKFSCSASLSKTRPTVQVRTFRGSAALLSSLLGTGVAEALTYEEALQRSVGDSSSDFDASEILSSVTSSSSEILSSVTSFATENPTFVAGGVTLLAVSFFLSQLLSKPKSWGVESAKKAYAALGEDKNAQLLDIRASAEFSEVGSPDVKGLGKKPVSIVFKRDDKPGFLKKLSLKFKEPGNTTLFIIDKFDGNSELVAELVTANGFKAAYAIKDGAEGPRGWKSSDLPWIPPRKALGLDFSILSDSISDALGEGSTSVPTTLTFAAAAAGLGLLAFQEIETILQVLGSAAIIQFASKKLLFAEDRKKTVKQLDEFVNTKVAPQELVDEIKQIGKALLPPTTTINALPAPSETSSEPASSTTTVQTAESPSPINSVKAKSVSGISRPLSPYPYYPDFKPPTSPSPSQP